MTESDTMTYICVGLCVRPCSPMHIYVWAYTYIGQACATVCVKKTLMSFKKIGKFLTNFTTFWKKPGMFLCKGRWDYLSSNWSFLLFRSSLHFNRNTRTINRLRMTGHPLILLSAAFIKSLQNLPSAFVFLILVEEVLRMKGGWKGGDEVSPHYQSPHKQGVSTANERRKEEVDFR